MIDVAFLSCDQIYCSTNANEMWLQWKRLFLSIVDKHAPLRTMRVRARSSPWILFELKKRMHDRDRREPGTNLFVFRNINPF